MSFPSEILRTTTNIAQRAIKEINDPALAAIGYKRLAGLTTVLGLAPAGIAAGFQALYPIKNKDGKNTGGTLGVWPDPKDYNL